jgi:hypothetical protein
VKVTDWGTAVLDILEASDVSQAELARNAFGVPSSKRDSLRHRVAINRYLLGARMPRSEDVQAINRSVERLIGVEGIEEALGAIAVLSALVRFDIDALAGAAFRLLFTLAGQGVLVKDWDLRFFKRISSLDESALRKVLASVCAATWKPLIDNLVGKLPVQSIYHRLSAALSKHNLSDLVARPSGLLESTVNFLTTARKELLTPPTTSDERIAAEKRLLKAAFIFAASAIEHRTLFTTNMKATK